MVWLEMLDILWLIGSVVVGIFVAIVGGSLGSGFQGKNIFRLVGVVWFAIVSLNVFGFALESLTSLTINVASISAVSIVVVTVIFAVLMRAPTVQGRKVMDQIDGLKLYIETAEKDRMNMEAEPPMTISRFERLLPYAIALGVEKPWSDHFEAQLARNAVADATDGHYSPGWYRGGGSPGSAGRAASTMTHAVSAAAASMTAAMVAAQPVQSSSSGFSGGGGGGSSGGGGGGGGGGGW
jgi:uncharacterized membrane protein